LANAAIAASRVVCNRDISIGNRRRYRCNRGGLRRLSRLPMTSQARCAAGAATTTYTRTSKPNDVGLRDRAHANGAEEMAR
jgi:hypothetical protein